MAAAATVPQVIIWRGFGFLAVIFGALGLLLGMTLSNAVSESSVNGPLLGLGLLIGAAATFAAGWWFNVINPAKKAQTWVEQRRAELSFSVSNGQFQPAPGIVPSSQEEAQAQADQLLAQESAAVAKRLRNVHTLFWIPMQWWGVLFALIALLLAILLLSS